MSATLLLDVGAGTLDATWLDEKNGLFYQAVLPSPIKRLAHEVAGLDGPTVISGREMGGGELAAALARKAKEQRLIITPAAAATISHRLEKVEGLGLELAVEEKALGLAAEPGWRHLVLSDVQPERLRRLLEMMGIEEHPSALGICLQDHGRPPAGQSHLAFRGRWLAELVQNARDWSQLGFESTNIPPFLGRLRSAAADAAELKPGKLFLMDSSLAAVCGAAAQCLAEGRQSALVVDAATSHTMAALFDGRQIAGYFELHTRDADVRLLDDFFEMLLAGCLLGEEVLARGGHGGWCRGQALQVRDFLAVGPKRKLLEGSKFRFRAGAPLGNNFLAGCAGLAAAMGLATPFSRL